MMMVIFIIIMPGGKQPIPTVGVVISVLAKTVNTSAIAPLVMNIFSPLMTYVLPSSDRVACD